MIHPVEKRCGNCRTELKFLKREKLQLGQTGWVLGDLPNLFAGAQDLEFWACPSCGKLEFFFPADAGDPQFEESDSMAQITCPTCGQSHDLDDPKCPFCGARNTTLYGEGEYHGTI